ncbi:hypothetical protein RIF23_06310 [Lipingzhangella sp. LS1_29]|uniref:LPXTG-motif cell wall-anchored protein n=1 Tax=Lipingzhangella rawalii TaxID=2055835 RepID=A0ABU2H3M2_9ACTN|nr:hypothetical protein [Lipingzhangella rawalii]MDS1269905.1 hypothetical protein [Lipingzhangella rawalii]
MARNISKRLAAGTSAAAFASVGFIAYAPGAFADNVVSYECTPSAIQDEFTTDVTYSIDAPSEVAAGESIDITVNGDSTEVPTSPVSLSPGDVSRTIPMEVYRDGEHVDTVETTAENSEEIPSGGEVETDPTTGSYTPEEEGTYTFEIGDFETTVSSLVTVNTPCVTEEPAIVHEAVVGDGDDNGDDDNGDDDNGDDDNGDDNGDDEPGVVTTPGRAEFTGTYECASSDPELLADFTSGAQVTVDTPDGTEFPADEDIRVTAEGTLDNGPETPVDLAEGDVVGTIHIAASGDAAPEDGIALSAANDEPFGAGDIIAGLDTEGTFTPGGAGAVEFAAGDLTISVLDGLVTIDCAWSGDDPGNGGDGDPGENGDDGDPGDDQQPPKDEADGQLPVTGAQLGGLVAAAVAALGGGGAAVYLSRKRKAAAEQGGLEG